MAVPPVTVPPVIVVPPVGVDVEDPVEDVVPFWEPDVVDAVWLGPGRDMSDDPELPGPGEGRVLVAVVLVYVTPEDMDRDVVMPSVPVMEEMFSVPVKEGVPNVPPLEVP